MDISSGFNFQHANSRTLSWGVPNPFKFTEHNFVTSNIKSLHPHIPAPVLLWWSRAARYTCSRNKHWRLISEGHFSRWSLGTSYQKHTTCRKAVTKRCLSSSGWDSEVSTDTVQQQRSPWTDGNRQWSPYLQNMKYWAYTQRWIEWSEWNKTDIYIWEYENFWFWYKYHS